MNTPQKNHTPQEETKSPQFRSQTIYPGSNPVKKSLLSSKAHMAHGSTFLGPRPVKNQSSTTGTRSDFGSFSFVETISLLTRKQNTINNQRKTTQSRRIANISETPVSLGPSKGILHQRRVAVVLGGTRGSKAAA